MTNCSVCSQEAVCKCECSKKNYCQKCFDKHKKKKGKHVVVKLEEIAAVKKSVSFAGSDGEQPKAEEESKVEVQEDRKVLLRRLLEREIVKVQRFHIETLACLSSQQQSLIKSIISDSKKLTSRVILECSSKQEHLEKTISELEVIGKVPFGHPILERIKKSSEGQSILKLEADFKKTELTPNKILDYKIAWMSNPIIDELKTFFNVHKLAIPSRLQKIYQKIFSEKHYSIKKINLNKSKIDAQGLEYLKKITPFFLGIKELRLASNKIQNENIEVLAECLTDFKQIQRLDLSENDLRGHGIEVLTPVLEEMSCLSYLGLAKNNFGATGARHLSMLLESLKKLKELDLDSNAFGSEGARYLSGVLPKLSSLKTLKLRNNNFADDSVRFLKVAFGRMNNIEQLKLEGNKFGNEEKRTMQLIVRKECKIEI